MASFETDRFTSHNPWELVRTAFARCFANGGQAFIAAAIMLVPATALNLAFMYLMGRTGALETAMSLQGRQVDPTQIDMHAFLRSMFVLAGGGVVVGGIWVLSGFAAAAAIGRMTAERALGRSFSAAQAWDFVLGKLMRLTGGGIVAGAVLVGGYIVASIPTAIVSIILLAATGGMHPGAKPSPAVQAISSLVMLPIMAAVGAYLASMPSVVGVEEMGGISAVLRSFRLVSGRLRHAAVTLALGGVICLGPVMALQMVMQHALLPRLTASMGGALGTLTAFGPATVLGLITWPMLFVLQAFIYFDLRSRQTEEDFTAYELTLEVGGELPEGVEDPFASTDPSGAVGPQPTPPVML